MTDQPFEITAEGQKYLDELNARLLLLAAESPDVDYDPLRRGGGISRCETEVYRGYTFCKHSVPKLRKLAIIIGALYLRFIQGSYSTSTSASVGTHAGGGAGDNDHTAWSETNDNWVMNLAREICLLVYWDRDAISGVWQDHGHWIDPHCPNLSPEAAAQVVDFYNGKNGLANDGPDFGSRKTVSQIWNAYKNRSSTTVAKIEALMFPSAPPEEEDMPLNEADKAWVKAAIREVLSEKATAEALWTGHNIVKDPEDRSGATRVTPSNLLERSTWSQQVLRDGQYHNALDEMTSILTAMRTFNSGDVARDNGVAGRLEDLHDALGAKISLVLEALGQAEEPPPNPPEPEPAFTFGWDMSGNQTVAQVQGVLADPTFAFGIMKVTEGQGFVNSKLGQMGPLLRDSKEMRGWYHYSWQSHDGRVEAEHFWKNAEPYAVAGDVLFCDVENWGPRDDNGVYTEMVGVSWAQRFDYYMDFRARLKELSGSIGAIYPTWDVIKGFRAQCGMQNADGSIKTTPTAAWLDFTKAGLWLPQYYITINGVRRAVKPGEYDKVSGGWDVFVHQYTSNPFDKNWMPGGPAHWAKHALT